MKDFFLKMLNTKDVTVSSGRFLSITTVLTILYVWGFVSVWLRAIQDIPVGVYTFAGLVLAGKAVATFTEKPSAGTTTTETMTKTTEAVK